MDSSRPSSPVGEKTYHPIIGDDRHPWSYVCELCSLFLQALILNDAAIEEPSVEKLGGDDSFVAETRGLEHYIERRDNTDSDDGRRLECGKFYTASPPASTESPSMHLCPQYVMVDGRLYSMRSSPAGRPHPQNKSSFGVKVEKLPQSGGCSISPLRTPGDDDVEAITH
jgi:hypothetical protein